MKCQPSSPKTLDLNAIFGTVMVFGIISIACFFAWDSFSSRAYDSQSGAFLFEVVAGHPSSDTITSVSKGLSREECLQEMNAQLEEIRMRNEIRVREQGPEAVLDANLHCIPLQK